MNESQAAAAFSEILNKLDVVSGDTIYLGIDIGGVPLPNYPSALNRQAIRQRELAWCAFVFNTLTDRLTRNGTLVVPAFSYSCGRPGSTFIMEDTPSEVGPFPEFVRQQPGVLRSLHPIFSVAAWGRLAEDLTTLRGSAAFGGASPFARLTPNGAKFLCLGVSLARSITYLHHLEQIYGCNHRYHKAFDTRVIAKGVEVAGPWLTYLTYRGLALESDFHAFEAKVRMAKCVRETNFNGKPNQAISAADVDRVGLEMLSENSCAFLNRKVQIAIEEMENTAPLISERPTLQIKPVA